MYKLKSSTVDNCAKIFGMASNNELYTTVSQLMQSGKGILAADESDPSAGKRLAMVDLPNNPGNRQDFREILFTAPGIEEFLSGVILYDSSIKNSTDQGVPFPDVLAARGIVPGIKVDMGLRTLPGYGEEQYTQGLDNLGDRLKEYFDFGARFTKWRGVVKISDSTPTGEALEMMSTQMALYAIIAQENGFVPIVEPEVLFPGNHTIQKAEAVTTQALTVLFTTLKKYKVDLKGTILKSSMVLAGDANTEQSTPEEVATATLRTFKIAVPKETGGIVFLSGGQTPKRATENLQAIASYGPQAWPITYSYSRAIEEPVLVAWQGKPENIKEAQKALLYRCKMNSLAQLGKYDSERDTEKK